MASPEIYVQETDKTVEVRDNLNVLKYRVILYTSKDLNEETEVETRYWVKVVAFDSASTAKVIYEKYYLIYNDAVADFNRNLDNYKILVRSQSRHLDDIHLYEEKIEYVVTKPDCCLYCVHSQKCGEFLECGNPDNFAVYSNLGPYSLSGYAGEDDMMRSSYLKVKPKVDILGKCKNFSRKDVDR